MSLSSVPYHFVNVSVLTGGQSGFENIVVPPDIERHINFFGWNKKKILLASKPNWLHIFYLHIQFKPYINFLLYCFLFVLAARYNERKAALLTDGGRQINNASLWWGVWGRRKPLALSALHSLQGSQFLLTTHRRWIRETQMNMITSCALDTGVASINNMSWL